MLQKERKSGHWQVERLQFLKREQRGLRLRYAVIDLQPCDLQTAKFSCLLHHKGALIFQIKRPLFWKNGQICPSLVVFLEKFLQIESHGGAEEDSIVLGGLYFRRIEDE